MLSRPTGCHGSCFHLDRGPALTLTATIVIIDSSIANTITAFIFHYDSTATTAAIIIVRDRRCRMCTNSKASCWSIQNNKISLKKCKLTFIIDSEAIKFIIKK